MQRESEKQVKVRSLLGAGLVVLVAVVWLAWWQWDRLCGVVCGEPAPAGAAGPVEAAPATASLPADAETAEGSVPIDAARRRWGELLGRPPEWPGDLGAPQDCKQVTSELQQICGVLDARPYLADNPPPGGTCSALQAAADALAARPPALSSELRSYSSMLENVFHVYRTVGSKRMAVLRKLAAEESELAEPIAMALFRWLASRERCAESGTPVRLTRLYDYATFLFQTFGGQAYLRRRAPRQEALAAFYALLVLDHAMEQDHNPHGVDPRPEIRRTRALLDAQPLVFRDRYVELLEQMDARWEARAAD